MRLCLLLVSLVTVLTGEGIEGRWRPLVTSKGGIGTMLDFRAQGVLWVRTGAVIESTYSVEGSQVIFPPATLDAPPQRQTIDLREPGVLRLWQGQRLNLELRRVGGAGPDPTGLAGEWVGKREMGGHSMTARMIFDGKTNCLYLMPFRSDRGSWTVTSGNLSLTWPAGQRLSGKYKIEGAKLTLPDGREYLRY